MTRPLAIVCALAAGCKARIGGFTSWDGGEPAGDAGGPGCPPGETNAPPAAPAIVEPAAGRIDVMPESLALEAAPYQDSDGDAQAGAEFEIWLAPGQMPATRVWSAAVGPGASSALADGEWDAPFSALDEWTDYAARTRHRDASGACDDWSGFGEWRFFRTDDGSTHMFDPSLVHTFELTIPPGSWDALNAEAYPGDCVQFVRNYYPATLAFEGEVFEGIGLRLKGGCGSARDLYGKAAFKINLGWDDPDVPGCPEERRLHGLQHMTLNNGVQDWTQAHERMGYRFYRAAGVPGARAAAAEVTVNGEWWGPYVHVESIDRRFLERWFAHEGGMMYEGAYWCDLFPWNVPWSVEENSCFTREFDTTPCDSPDPDDDATDWELLRDFTEQIAALPNSAYYPEIEGFFDFDRFLSMWAVEGLIAHWDAYSFTIINNYRVYHEPLGGLWTMIPWGIDQTYLGDLDPWESDATLVTRCRGEPDCEAAFAARLYEMVDLFESLDFRSEAEAIRAQVEPLILADPRNEYDDWGYWDAHSQTVGFIDGRADRVRQILADHGF